MIGVMRFLQIEWHNHERARNAWDIERAEMRQKITKMQGENNQLKRTAQVLEKHVKMLERAIGNERKRHKAMQAGDQPVVDEKIEPDLDTQSALKTELKKGMKGSRARGHSLLRLNSEITIHFHPRV